MLKSHFLLVFIILDIWLIFLEIPESLTPNSEACFKFKLKAEEAIKSSNYNEAVDLLTSALGHSLPAEGGLKEILNRTQLLQKRAECLLKLKRPCASIYDCNVCLDLHDQNAAALMCRGVAYRQIWKWEESLKDLSAAMVINCNPELEPTLKLVRRKVKEREEELASAFAKKEEREALLQAARERDEAALSQLLGIEEEDGYLGHPDKKSLRFDMRGEDAHLKWMNDRTDMVAEGIFRLGRCCPHNTFTDYLIRLDLRGHLISEKGILRMACALKEASQIVTLRISAGGIDFDTSDEVGISAWRLYSFPLSLETMDENRTQYLLSLSSIVQLEALGRLLYARPRLLQAKVDVKKAYAKSRNKAMKLSVIIDPNSVPDDIPSGIKVHEKIKIAFLIAFILESNPLIWLDQLCMYDNELWFALVTTSPNRVMATGGLPLSAYLDPIDSCWQQVRFKLHLSFYTDL